jgi:serine/threonine protein kinase
LIQANQYPRGNFYRFLIFLIFLRLVDMSYMSVLLGPCSSIVGSLAWLVWLPIELYVLFRSDTAYWKSYIERLSRKPKSRYMCILDDGTRTEMSLDDGATKQGAGGSIYLYDSLLVGARDSHSLNSINNNSVGTGGLENDVSGWLSPAQSHWVQPQLRYRDPPAYRYPPTHVRLRNKSKHARDAGDSFFDDRGVTIPDSMHRLSSGHSVNSGTKSHIHQRSRSVIDNPTGEIFDEVSAAVRLERILASTSVNPKSQNKTMTWSDLDSRRKARRLQRRANANLNVGQSKQAHTPTEAENGAMEPVGANKQNKMLAVLSSASVGPRMVCNSEKKEGGSEEAREGNPYAKGGQDVEYWGTGGASLKGNEGSHRVSIPPVEKITLDFSGVQVQYHHQLDSGSTAKVYEGRFCNQRVAVKLCRLRTLNQKSVADFVREARTLAAFSHPNVMRLVGCCPVPPHFMIVSEYCSRGNLAKVLHDEGSGKMTAKMRLFLALGAAKGVAHVHSKGFMHGDIKPDNFIVTEDWTVKISDFGEASQQNHADSATIAAKAAKAAKVKAAAAQGTGISSHGSLPGATGSFLGGLDDSVETANGIVGGTIAWLAPERLAPIYKLFLDLEPEGSNTSRWKQEWAKYGSGLTKAADVYSFSLVVWEIFTGKRPFLGMDSFEIGLAVLTVGLRPELEGDVEGSSTILNVIPGMKSMLRAAWAGNPSFRPEMPQICQEISAAFTQRR